MTGKPGTKYTAPAEPCGEQKKTWNLVVGVGDDGRSLWELAHLQPLLVVGAIRFIRFPLLHGHLAHARFNKFTRLWVQYGGHTERLRRTVAGVVVWRGTNAAGAKDHITRRKRTLQRGRNARRIVSHIFRPREAQAALPEKFDDFAQMLVDALAG